MGIVTTNTDHRWPGRQIPFVIDETDFPSDSPERKMVQKGINAWNAQPFAPLVERAGETDYVRFREADANLFSAIGRQGGEQGIYCDIGSSRQRLIPNQQSQASPALAFGGTLLHMVHLGDSSKDIWYSFFDANSGRAVNSSWAMTPTEKMSERESSSLPEIASGAM